MRIKHDRQTHRLRGDHFLWETNRTILLYKDHGQLSLYFLWSLDRNYKKILDCSLYVFYNLKTTILWWVCLWGGGWGDQERQVDHPIFLVFILTIIIVILHYYYSFMINWSQIMITVSHIFTFLLVGTACLTIPRCPDILPLLYLEARKTPPTEDLADIFFSRILQPSLCNMTKWR